MSSTFTQPIRVFKRNNPSNDGTIAPDNTGAARLSQQSYITNPIAATTGTATTLTTADIGSTTVTPFVLPAGSIIEGFALYQDTAAGGLVGGVITVSISQTNPTTGAVTTTAIGTVTPTAAGGRIAGVFTATAATAAIIENIGTLDATLTFSAASVTTLTSGAVGGVITVDYTARNNDGSIAPYGSGYTNN
jgi:hypothetical protein